MRISDWSSDVCSSDLADVDAAIADATRQGALVVASAGNSGVPFYNKSTADIALVVGATTKGDEKAYYSTSGDGVKIFAPGGAGGEYESGRASCRERVCQDV